MELSTHSANKIKVLLVHGDMNANTSNQVLEKLKDLIMGGDKRIVINLENLNYISSAGLRVLLSANRLIKKKEGVIHICGLNNTAKEVFEISGFDMIFKTFDSEEEALEAF